MRRTRTVAALTGLAAAALSWFLATTPSNAAPVTASITKFGWWSQQPAAQPQPDNGFQVSEGPQGPQSVAALELNVAQGDGVTVTLTLTEGQSVAPDRAGLQVCSTNGGWPAANPGTFTDAPPSECGRPVALTRDATSTTWKGDITALAAAGATSDIMILPVAQPVGGVLDPGFQVTITKAAITADATASTGPDQFGFAPPPTTPSDSGSGSGSSSGFTPPSSSTFTPSTPTGSTDFASAAPVVPPAAAPAVAAPAPDASAAAPAPAAEPTPFGSTGGPAGKRAGDHRPWGRLIIFLPLAVAVGGATTWARQMSFFGAASST